MIGIINLLKQDSNFYISNFIPNQKRFYYQNIKELYLNTERGSAICLPTEARMQIRFFKSNNFEYICSLRQSTSRKA